VFLSMEIVVRTPHGDADVAIVSFTEATTLGEIVATVTGQAVPRLVELDGHAVDAATPLAEAALFVGSVLTSEPSNAVVASDADVELVQIAGPGAGRIGRLGPGRYRIGPGRRTSADQLAPAPVEHTVFELVVQPTGAASVVDVVAGPIDTSVTLDRSAPALGGRRLDEPARWERGTLTVGARAFQLEAPAIGDAPRALARPGPDGTIAFSRPPRPPTDTPRRPVVDALCDATAAAPSLWERRLDRPGALELPLGVRADGSGGVGADASGRVRDDDIDVVTIDLDAEPALAIVGSDAFRTAAVRALVIEAATLHGPADLDLVVLTAPDRLGHWDWAKWLPHGRRHGAPAIWSSARDIARWVADVASATPAATIDTPRVGAHRTLVILDDPPRWIRRESPMRAIASDLPDDLRLVALCDEARQAPATCTIVVSETPDGLADVRHVARSGDGVVIRPALPEAGIAVRIARALAPLVDVEQPLPPTNESAPVGTDRVELPALLGATGRDEIATRWAADDPRAAVPIGRREAAPVQLDVADDVTVVLGSAIGDAFDVAAAWVLGQALDRSPRRLWIAPIVPAGTDRAAWWWQLPHATERYDVDGPIDEDRLLTRLRAVLADPAGPARVLVVVEISGPSASSDLGWLHALGDGVRAIDGLALLVVTDRADVAELADTVVTVDGRAAPGTSTRRRSATLTPADGTMGVPFEPLQRSAPPTVTLVLEPFVVGRPVTPLERRLEQQRSQAVSSPEPAFGPVVAELRAAATAEGAHAASRAILPPPMPTRVDLDELFADSPGDGIPLGLVDDPAAAGAKVLWWQPGLGAMLLFGSRRSGVDQVLTTIIAGVADRFSDDDVQLTVVDASSTRRRAIADLGRDVRLVAPDHADDVAALLDQVEIELGRRSEGAAADGRTPVVLIGDLVQLRRRYADQPLGARIDDVMGRAAAAGIDVVATAAELDGAGPFALDAPRWIVGASSNHDELRTLGVERPGDLDGIAGRCRSFPGGQLVQLALADAPTELLLARRSPGSDA
jgi:S-DNA-T family DNA segregation ATPase FtsK/SpoIIIE